LRLGWAARRLSEGLDVGQAAAEAGYDSVAAFGRAFRQRYGHAPSGPVLNEHPALQAVQH
jgi:AraC-like DNA-binding protein